MQVFDPHLSQTARCRKTTWSGDPAGALTLPPALRGDARDLGVGDLAPVVVLDAAQPLVGSDGLGTEVQEPLRHTGEGHPQQPGHDPAAESVARLLGHPPLLPPPAPPPPGRRRPPPGPRPAGGGRWARRPPHRGGRSRRLPGAAPRAGPTPGATSPPRSAS